MALAGQIDKVQDIGGGLKLLLGTLSFDSSYPTGGEDINNVLDQAGPETQGVEIVHHLSLQMPGYVARLVPGSELVMLYQQSAATGALTQVPNATDLSAVTNVPFFAIAS